ncbi:MAG: hypothetical protein ACYDC3_07035, partial [Candidatus Binataceae bacterium]
MAINSGAKRPPRRRPYWQKTFFSRTGVSPVITERAAAIIDSLLDKGEGQGEVTRGSPHAHGQVLEPFVAQGPKAHLSRRALRTR